MNISAEDFEREIRASLRGNFSIFAHSSAQEFVIKVSGGTRWISLRTRFVELFETILSEGFYTFDFAQDESEILEVAREFGNVANVYLSGEGREHVSKGLVRRRRVYVLDMPENGAVTFQENRVRRKNRVD